MSPGGVYQVTGVLMLCWWALEETRPLAFEVAQQVKMCALGMMA